MIYSICGSAHFLNELALLVQKHRTHTIILPTQRLAFQLSQLLPRSFRVFTCDKLPLIKEGNLTVISQWQKVFLLRSFVKEFDMTSLPYGEDDILALLAECELYKAHPGGTHGYLEKSEQDLITLIAAWPTFIEKYGFIEANANMNQRVESFINNFPQQPVCVAGFFGNVPSHASLMKCASEPKHLLVFSNADSTVLATGDLPEYHPQRHFQNFFKEYNLDPHTIQAVGYKNTQNEKKCLTYSNSFSQLTGLVELIKQYQKDDVMVVLPSLARMNMLAQLLTDSEIPFQQTVTAKLNKNSYFVFAKALLTYIQKPSFAALLVLLKHSLFKQNHPDLIKNVTDFEIAARQKQPFFVFPTDCKLLLANDQLNDLITQLKHPHDKIMTFYQWLEWHFSLVSVFVGSNTSPDISEDFFDQFKGQSNVYALPLSLTAYGGLFDSVFTNLSPDDIINPPDFKSNIRLVGPHEARLTSSDITLVTDADERFWPQGISSNISTHLRSLLGLPNRHAYMALQAHDFISLAQSATQVLFTVSESIKSKLVSPTPLFYWLGAIKNLRIKQHEDNEKQNIKNNQQEIFLGVLPKSLSISALELAVRDFESFYQRYILGLFEIPLFFDELTARTRGILIHRLLELYLREPDTAVEKSKKLLRAVLSDLDNWQHGDEIVQIISWCVRQFKKHHGRSLFEHKFIHSLICANKTITLHGRADLIHLNGVCQLVDIKTGSTVPSKRAMEIGKSIQIPLLLWLMQKNNFTNVKAEIWHVKRTGSKKIKYDLDLASIEENVVQLINSLNQKLLI